MKKKLTSLTLSLVLALSLVACGGEKKTDTAQAEATTETSVASEEETEEAEPVAEEPEAEIAEETPEEEIVEEILPTTTEEIKDYFSEKGEIGDYIISDDDFLVMKLKNSRPRPYPIKMIDGQIYTDDDRNTSDGHAPYIDLDVSVNSHTFYRDPNHDNGYYDTYKSIEDKIQEHEYVSSLRVEPTDDPNLIKIMFLFPKGTIDWIKNNIPQLNLKKDIEKYINTHGMSPREYNEWLQINPRLQNGEDRRGVLIPLDEINDDVITFVTPKENLLSTFYINNFDEKLLTPEGLTGLVYNSGIEVYVTFQMPADEIDAYSNYTLVTD